VFVDSPMACDATQIFVDHPEDHDLETTHLTDAGKSVLRTGKITFCGAQEDSKRINDRRDSMIIISASGMCNGGRILHHLVQRLPDRRNTVLFVGYQAVGTRGRSILDGVETVKIHGVQVPAKARIENIPGFSAHADYNEILRWLRGFRKPPKRTFIVHGEPVASTALAEHIRQELGWETHIPRYLESVELA